MATTWQFINHLLAGKEAADMLLKMISWMTGKKLPSPNDPVPEGKEKEKGQKDPTLPEGTAQKIQSFGKSDDLGLATLRSLYWSTDLVLKPGQKEVLTIEQRTALGYFLSALNPNQRVAFKRILGLGGGKHVVQMTFKEVVAPAAGDAKSPATRPVTESIHLAPESVIILRGMTNDILKGHATEALQQEAAKALAQRLNDLDVFANIADDIAQARESLKGVLGGLVPPELCSPRTLRYINEARQRIGWKGVQRIIDQPYVDDLRRRIRNAPNDASLHSEVQREFRSHLLACCKEIVSRPQPRFTWLKGRLPWIMIVITIVGGVIMMVTYNPQ